MLQKFLNYLHDFCTLDLNLVYMVVLDTNKVVSSFGGVEICDIFGVCVRKEKNTKLLCMSSLLFEMSWSHT